MTTTTDDLGTVRELLATDHRVTNPAPLLTLIDGMGAANGTMRQWMADHDGRAVNTYQMEVRDGRLSSVWSPGPRVVDTARASYVNLGDSRRDYAGCTVLRSSGDTLAVRCPFGDALQVIIYVAAGATV